MVRANEPMGLTEELQNAISLNSCLLFLVKMLGFFFFFFFFEGKMFGYLFGEETTLIFLNYYLIIFKLFSPFT
jgi:hypothetical protein